MTVLMGRTPRKVYRRFTLSPARLQRLKQVAQARQVSESEVIEKALDVFFSLAAFFEDDDDSVAWHLLSEKSLERVWANDMDAVYDDWRALYDVPKG